MAKDPAFLFYPGDWQGGTLTFTRFLKGCYMDVLIAQFNNGHLSLEEIKTVLGSDFGQAWPTLQKKFVQDARGLFFNERLDTEMFKRKEYSKSRAENRKGKNKKHMNNISETHVESYVKHMENEDENRNKDLKNKKESSAECRAQSAEIDFTKPDINGDDIVFPLDTAPFRELWAHWKKYRWEVHSARYGMMGEQADLKRLDGLDFTQAQQTILTAIAGKWKNLYPEKTKTFNGNGTSKTKHQQHTDSLIADFAARRGSTTGK